MSYITKRYTENVEKIQHLLQKGEAQEINADMIEDVLDYVEHLQEQLAEANAAYDSYTNIYSPYEEQINQMSDWIRQLQETNNRLESRIRQYEVGEGI